MHSECSFSIHENISLDNDLEIGKSKIFSTRKHFKIFQLSTFETQSSKISQTEWKLLHQFKKRKAALLISLPSGTKF